MEESKKEELTNEESMEESQWKKILEKNLEIKMKWGKSPRRKCH